MLVTTARIALPRLSVVAAGTALALMLAGCGGGSSSNSNTAQPTDTPSESATPFAGSSPSGHHRHHHRKHRSADANADSNASTSPDAEETDGSDTSSSANATAQQAASGNWPCADATFLKDQQQFAAGSLTGDQEVDVCGNVTRVLDSKTTRSGLHGYFDITVAPGTTIEIVSDLAEMNAPAWPWVKVGDYAYVQGRYYYDSESRQGIDWTHHGTSRSWPSAGYVVVGGTQYQ